MSKLNTHDSATALKAELRGHIASIVRRRSASANPSSAPSARAVIHRGPVVGLKEAARQTGISVRRIKRIIARQAMINPTDPLGWQPAGQRHTGWLIHLGWLTALAAGAAL